MKATVGAAGRRIRRMMALVRRARRIPPAELSQRLALRVYSATNAGSLKFPLLTGDVTGSLDLPEQRPRVRVVPEGRPLRVGWVMSPPGPGSGGHTTLLRMVEELERRGHECTLFLYDRYRGDARAHAAIVRSHWPQLRSRVRDARSSMDGMDVMVATSWDSAHVLGASAAPGRRCYFIQDFEPFFYARGAEYELATDSYRFGFRLIALGDMVAELLRTEVGVDSVVVPFGADTTAYGLLPSSVPREGVVFYARPDTPRRGYQLGKFALEEFHRLEPAAPIHVYGASTHDIDAPVVNHGVVSPARLNALYNQVVAGLTFSFTNVSLVAAEMLAAGTIPVINDSPFPKFVLNSTAISWTAPTPRALAKELQRLVNLPDIDARAAAAASERHGAPWAVTAEHVCAVIEGEGWSS